MPNLGKLIKVICHIFFVNPNHSVVSCEANVQFFIPNEARVRLARANYKFICDTAASLLGMHVFAKGWGQNAKLGPHSAIWGKLGTAL